MPLQVGDSAPEWTLRGAVDGSVDEIRFRDLLDRHPAVVMMTYPLDFSGG